MDDVVFQLVITLMAVVGVGVGGALLARIAAAGSRVRALADATPVRAVVVDNQAHSRAEGRTSWSPVVRYRDAGGTERTVVVQDTASSSWIRGTDVDVLLDPARPGDVLLAGRAAAGQRRFGIGFATVVALFFVAFGVVTWVGFGSALAGGAWWAGPFGTPPDAFDPQFPSLP